MRERALQRWRRRPWAVYLLAGLACLLLACLAAWAAYQAVPGVRFRLQSAWSEAYESLGLRAEVVPTAAVAYAAPPALVTPSPLPTVAPPSPTANQPAAATGTLSPTPSPAPPTATPPPRVVLNGFQHEYQLYNNCGPASLSVNLSFWGWSGNQKVAAAVLKPNQDDKNVSPRELYEFLLTQGFDAYIRVGGDVDTLKRFIAAGYPVLVEKGYTCEKGARCQGWFGHYSVFTGYDDAQGVFITQDTYLGPNLKLSYEEVLNNWRAFNFLYLVVFPAGPERDAEVQQLLGPALDLDRNYRAALDRAQSEALTLSGPDAALAWFNVGTNLAYLKDYAGAAAAYDQARQIGLPYRMLWYQFGPYLSYYYMARYQDVIGLATFAIESVTPGVVPGLEEAYFWRGQALESIGQPEQAAADYRLALERHPDYAQALQALAALGQTP